VIYNHRAIADWWRGRHCGNLNIAATSCDVDRKAIQTPFIYKAFNKTSLGTLPIIIILVKSTKTMYMSIIPSILLYHLSKFTDLKGYIFSSLNVTEQSAQQSVLSYHLRPAKYSHFLLIPLKYKYYQNLTVAKL